ncbi:hypothetical protein [Bradyrhizobium sp. BWC-3-1]|uniref:hypothetical protein n=1 Tax=Bradyrhizobium sp. BWC-3-1 TaxID=3080012 RepID=UPI00293EAB53|nr:hypothetical protein [Bradyrhizobium sp. BWC-3-1]WOH62838.1 hypothetical protein RX329_24370 [Bradyrhizobium sp. BWC-3-1]
MIVVDLLADRGEPLIHRESEGVARLRAVEGDPPDPVLALENEVFRLHLLVHFLDVLLLFYIFECKMIDLQAGTCINAYIAPFLHSNGLQTHAS